MDSICNLMLGFGTSKNIPVPAAWQGRSRLRPILRDQSILAAFDTLGFSVNLPSRELTYPFTKAFLKMIFLFPRWDMSVSWRVSVEPAVIYSHHEFCVQNSTKYII